MRSLSSWAGMVCFIFVLAEAGCGKVGEDSLTYLDNGQIRIGISTRFGGALVYLAESSAPGRNYVNRHDSGRFVQYSYYGLPRSDDGVYVNWPWNPVAGGDGYGNPSRILSISNDGTEIVVRCNPMDWSGRKRRTGTVFETRYTLDGRAARIQNTLYNDGSDHAMGAGGPDQEIPAVFVTSDLSRLTFYSGVDPYHGGDLTVAEPGPPEQGASFKATECWAAYVNASNFGVGVCVPGVTRIGNAYRFGEQGSSDDWDNSTNYFAFCGVFDVTPHLARTDIAYVILDTLDNIRDYAAGKHQSGERTGTEEDLWQPDGAGAGDAFPASKTVIRGESLMFTTVQPDERPAARLLFSPEEVIRLFCPEDGTVYEEGRDFLVDGRNARLLLTDNTRIPHTPLGCLYPERGGGMLPHRDGIHDLYCASWRPFHCMQLEVDYSHAPEDWPGTVACAEDCGEDLLPRTRGLIAAGGLLRITVLGDSISVGAEASGWWGDLPPYSPPWPPLVAEALRRGRDVQVSLTNLSVGGTTSEWGLAQVGDVVRSAPDLLVLAFGMNDQSQKVTANRYTSNIAGIVNAVRQTNKDTEFLLVAPMVSSPEWKGTSIPLFEAYAGALHGMAEKSVAVADMTAVWIGMLSRKPFHALTGNGINHPNDFGHRLYAQVILGALGLSANPQEP